LTLVSHVVLFLLFFNFPLTLSPPFFFSIWVFSSSPCCSVIGFFPFFVFVRFFFVGFSPSARFFFFFSLQSLFPYFTPCRLFFEGFLPPPLWPHVMTHLLSFFPCLFQSNNFPLVLLLLKKTDFFSFFSLFFTAPSSFPPFAPSPPLSCGLMRPFVGFSPIRVPQVLFEFFPLFLEPSPPAIWFRLVWPASNFFFLVPVHPP